MAANLYHGGDDLPENHEINVTPFIDVMLVLLIIFMVTAPMMTEGIDVRLPETRTVDALPAEGDHVVVSVTVNGEVYLDETHVDLDALPQALRDVTAGTGRQVYLRADKGVLHGAVVEVMGAIRESGVEGFGMVAERSAGERP